MGRHDLLLARVPAELAGHARLVVEWLVGDAMEFSELGQAEVQRLLWLDLPTRWTVSPAQWPQVAEATAQVLDLAGRPTLAVLARSDETREILAAHARSGDDGAQAAEAAYVKTGTMPPDTDLLVWGSRHSGPETHAHDELRRVLEAAVVAGDYVPGTAGWRQRQQALTDRWLTTPTRLFDAQRPVDVIHGFRREQWSTTGTPARCVILGEIEPLLREPLPAPEGEPAPLVWLLDQIGQGVRLTQRGYLPPSIVKAADERFGWSPPPFRATRESDLAPLLELHELLREHRLLTKRRDQLRPSARCRALREAPGRFWEVSAVAWLGTTPFEIRVGEIACAVMLRGSCTLDDLSALAHEAVAPEFRDRHGRLVPEGAAYEVVVGWFRRAVALGFADGRVGGLERSLSEVGRPAALTALRARAHSAVS
ncbi:hypothetical protein ABN034_03405 [Actinopolymorpha sp. B11F2]|uniref:hypothetical protein n=1 Tax=Actinopolymorpha sp. B11F2 TaxID=3160862 RepID=UPI0032E468B6